jgi:hypothetical protein
LPVPPLPLAMVIIMGSLSGYGLKRIPHKNFIQSAISKEASLEWRARRPALPKIFKRCSWDVTLAPDQPLPTPGAGHLVTGNPPLVGMLQAALGTDTGFARP